MLNPGIRRRVLFVALAPVVATALALAGYFTLLRYGDVETALQQRGWSMARQLAPAAEYGMFSGNAAELSRLTQAMLHQPDVIAVSFFDPEGHPIATSGQPLLPSPSAPGKQEWSRESEDGSRLLFHTPVIQIGLAIEDPFSNDADNRSSEGRTLGSLTVELSRHRVIARRQEILVVTLLSVLLISGAAGLLARRLARDISEPLMALEQAVDRIRQGEFTVRVPHQKTGTLKNLEEGVNAMAAALERARSRSRAALASSEAELNEQYEFANALLQAQSDADVGLLILQGSHITYANDALLGILACGRGELYAWENALHEMVPDLAHFLQQLVDDTPGKNSIHGHFEAKLVTKQGEKKAIDVAIARMQGGQPPRLVAVILDITQRKQDEERLAIAYRQLQQQKDEAERASLGKSRFLAAASHDLRQPLHALHLFATDMLNHVETESQHRIAGQIGRATQVLGELMDALLDISRLDIAEIVPCIEPIALDPLIQSVIESYQQEAENKGLTLRSPPTSLWVGSDPRLLKRILGNLVSNAVRYTVKGGLVVGARRRGQYVSLEVWDSGIGISPQHVPYLFDEFFQVSNPERDATKGLGLGLAIVDRLARALGHPVRIHSRPGKGSVFGILMPRTAPTLNLASPVEEAMAEDMPSIALAISSERLAGEVTRLLTSWSYRVEAIPPTASGSHSVSAVCICDDASLEKLTSSRAQETTPHYSVLLLSSESMGNPVLPCVAGRLDLPVRPARLRALLQHLVGPGEAPSKSSEGGVC